MAGLKSLSRRQGEIGVGDYLRSTMPETEFRASHPNHFRRWEDAVVDGVSLDLIEADFGGGSGNELQGDPPKFCAAYSSSALCANVFGPARSCPGWLHFDGLHGFTEFQFEKKLVTGLGGTPPNLDFVATSPDSILAVESKFLETLGRKVPKFADSYRRAYAGCGCERLNAAYEAVAFGEVSFSSLDAAQLLKHALGIVCYRNHAGAVPSSLYLGYVFWEPENWRDFRIFRQHREELEQFSALIERSKVEFRPLSYLDLWDSWRSRSESRTHALSVERRYRLTL
ncbi:MAG: hypothetical protein CMO55_23130 [Verrucomicrobiales bacterium]|nr:hypothetical protein [Verrucomicrobiales bacterium]